MPTVLRTDLPPEIDEVFRRVLSKQPGDRYQSCREFIDAARMALGIFGRGTESSFGHGSATAGPWTGAPPSSQAEAPPDRYSWSSPPSRAHAAEPVDPIAPGSVAAGSPAGLSGTGQPWGAQPGASQAGYGQASPGQHGGTLTSHRREFGTAGPGEPGQPVGAPPRSSRPREPRWYRRPRWLAALAAVILVAAGLGTWAGLSRSGSHAKGTTTMPSTSAKPKPATSALMNALILANHSADATGKLPPSTCKQDNPTTVTCTAPASGISGVVFQTYPSLKAMYTAYTAKVSSLNSGQFRQDFSDCGSQGTYGEVGWNHLFQHTKAYSVDQMTKGTVTDDQAAGRVFCNYTQGLEYMVWTQDDGRLMGYAAGPVHASVWTWWVAVHHNIGLGGAPMHM